MKPTKGKTVQSLRGKGESAVEKELVFLLGSGRLFWGVSGTNAGALMTNTSKFYQTCPRVLLDSLVKIKTDRLLLHGRYFCPQK